MASGADQRSGERRAEGRRRLAAIERVMAAEGLDALIVHGTTGCGVAMNGNYAWVSGHVPSWCG